MPIGIAYYSSRINRFVNVHFNDLINYFLCVCVCGISINFHIPQNTTQTQSLLISGLNGDIIHNLYFLLEFWVLCGYRVYSCVCEVYLLIKSSTFPNIPFCSAISLFYFHTHSNTFVLFFKFRLFISIIATYIQFGCSFTTYACVSLHLSVTCIND